MGNERDSKIDLWTTPDSLFMISCWVRDGLTDKDLCQKIGVSPNTLIKWKNNYPEFERALSKSREIVDYEVENALYKRAIGYKTTEVKTIISDRDNQGNKTVRIEKIEKEVLPDTTACLAWLNNRKPDKWKRNRDNFSDGTSANNNITIKIAKADNGNVTLSAEATPDEDEWEKEWNEA